MPRSGLFPSDIMDKHAAFAGAINQYLLLVKAWETRRFDPNQPCIPAGQRGAGQWPDENGGDPVSEETLIGEAPNDGASRFQGSFSTETT